MANARIKRPKRDAESDEDDEEDSRMPYWVPEDGIDIEPLALYTRSILDEEAKVKLGNHPQRTTEKGFWIISRVAVSREDIAAMIADTKAWNREKKKGHYVNSNTAKERLRAGRAPQGRDQAAQMRARREAAEDPRAVRQSTSRPTGDREVPYMPPPQPITRGSADNVTMVDRQRTISAASPSPRPASVQPAQLDPRRPSAAQQVPGNVNPGYFQATAQYTVQANIPAQFAYPSDTSMYDVPAAAPPPPYSSDNKFGGGDGQPSTTGTQGFQSIYATSGGPPRPRAPNQGQQRRHGS